MGSNWLLDYRHKVTSQHGEDGVIEKIFEIISPVNKWCVEFGASTGGHISNTFNLIKNKGWQSVQIELDNHKFKDLQNTYADDPVTCLNKSVGFAGSDMLDEILEPTKLPRVFDLLSIDVDGYDYQIWEAFANFQPALVIIEFNTLLGHKNQVQSISPGKEPGASLKAMNLLAKEKGYELIAVIGLDLPVNAFYVTKELYSLFEIDNNNFDQYIDEDGNWTEESEHERFDRW